jgi:hypothetical protein
LVEGERAFLADDLGDAVEEAVVFGGLAHVWRWRSQLAVWETMASSMR